MYGAEILSAFFWAISFGCFGLFLVRGQILLWKYAMGKAL